MSNGSEQSTQDQVRERLLADRARLVERVRNLEKDVRHRTERLPADFAEQAVELEDKEVLEALDEDAWWELRQIDQALKRMEEGEFGICSACGEDINPERLNALPSTTLCIQCASREEVQERQGADHPTAQGHSRKT